MTRRAQRTSPSSRVEAPPEGPFFGEDEPAAVAAGERIRRLALGATAALLVARACWPGEDAETGSGLIWVLAVLAVAVLAVASWWLRGALHFRASWADVAVIAVVALVAISVQSADDRRAAINVAWEWAGFGIMYLLLRNLPTTRTEVSALAGCLVATASALSVTGLYQVAVEDPSARAYYLRAPEQALRAAGVADDPLSRKRFEDRLLGSREPRATFALANSLAGYLVGPSVVLLAAVLTTVMFGGAEPKRVVAIVLALIPVLALLTCLVLTKSRSAYLGLLVGLTVVVSCSWSTAYRRKVLLALAALLAAGALLVGAMTATGQLDRQVVTEATKSLRYRGEWWIATARLLTESGRTFWKGVGPGNFGGPYLRHKLVTSSEEIKDPHNLILEVWATSGAFAAVALGIALGLILWECLGTARSGLEDQSRRPSSSGSAVWLSVVAGLAGPMLALAFGKTGLANEDLTRLAVLTTAWGVSALLIAPLWGPRVVTAASLGAAVIAVVVNLLAAGGASIPPVAIGLWALAALGLDLREDRPRGSVRIATGGRGVPIGLGFVSVAVLGAFVGSVAPYWRAQALLARANATLAVTQPTPNQFESARKDVLAAARVDKLWAQPWLELANLEFRDWLASGAKPDRNIGIKLKTCLDNATAPPRGPNALPIQRQRMLYFEQLATRIGDDLPPSDLEFLHREALNAAAKAVSLYPNDANLNARLAEAAALMNRPKDAAWHARQALSLDAATPHDDKKLTDSLRSRMRELTESG